MRMEAEPGCRARLQGRGGSTHAEASNGVVGISKGVGFELILRWKC